MNNRHPVILRLIIDLVLAGLVLQGWWYLAVPLAIIAAWNFSFYIEIVLAGFAYDALFAAVPGAGIRGHLGIIVALVSLGVIYILKKVIRK